MIPLNWNTDILSEVTKTRKRTWLHKVCTINRYLLGAVVGKWLSSKPCQFVKKNIFSAPNFFMHILSISVTYLQSVKKIQWKPKEELISQSIHYQPLFTWCSCRKIAKFKTLSVCQKNIFSAPNFFMHIFSIPVTYLQSVKKIQWKLKEELISQSMHYESKYKHLIVRITKRHNSCNTDPSAPIFLSHAQCLMVIVWCKLDRNRTKAVDVIKQKTLNVDGITDWRKRTCWKQYTTLKLCFVGGWGGCITMYHVFCLEF